MICVAVTWRLLDRHGLSFKKTVHAAEQQRPDVWQRRRAWFEAQPKLGASSSLRRRLAAFLSGIGSGAS